jgi:glutamate/tyrosine decarboxylase-like PLP-dependent enzyme
MHIPERGRTKEEILQTLEAYSQGDLPWDSGRVMAYVYDPGKETSDVARSAYMMYLTQNALDPTTYPSVMRLEREVVRMIINLLRGDESVVGNMTSGGTESILLAVKTARDWSRAQRPDIKVPEMILPRTAHAAFHKAAAYFDVKPVIAGFDTTTYKADVDAMRRAVNKNTILLVGSAPGYAQGVIDPIEEIGALAQERGLLFHVDACVGGIHLSIMRKMGYPLPSFDFSVPGVTSISADMHKYGYAPKNASVVMYRSKELRKHQIYSCRHTTIYALINPTILSTKSGGPMAASWATLNFLGEDGYAGIVKAAMDATKRLLEGISATPDLRILGKPDMCMFSMASDTVNVFQVADEMRDRGWYVQPQFSTDLSPPNLHITVNHSSVALVDEFLDALRESVEAVKKSGVTLDPTVIKSQLDQMLGNLTPEGLQQILAMAGISGTKLPEHMALINTIMDNMPDAVVEELLTGYINDLFQ